ncbi:MAG: hypothetical protein MUQ56_06280 [Thermoleophilia bacterium]|nr:hypothetical protein [Thermoleophilia bacterium]
MTEQTPAQLAALNKRRNDPRCLWATWFDVDGYGPATQVLDNGDFAATDIQVEWNRTPLGPHVCVASTMIGGLYLSAEDGRELAARLLRAADIAEAHENDGMGIVWSREQSLAITKLEECVMHANSAIARNE